MRSSGSLGSFAAGGGPRLRRTLGSVSIASGRHLPTPKRETGKGRQWRHARRLPDKPWILLLEGPQGPQADIVSRSHALGFFLVRAKTPSEAVSHVQRMQGDGVGLLSSDFPMAEPQALLRSIRNAGPGRQLRFVVVGPRPEASVRTQLRDAGLRLALWEPFDDGALRFQLNRALYEKEQTPSEHRREVHVPTVFIARVVTQDRQKDVIVYNLSTGGAFLETPRPSPRSSRIELELPLPSARIRVFAKVGFTNVPGNLERPQLPHGMGVAFESLAPQDLEAIRRYVEERARGLEV
jgi:PilZ domain